MKGLGGDDEIDAVVRERGGLGAAIHAVEVWVMCEQTLRCGTHVGIGLHGMDGAAGAQKECGGNAGAGTDICNDGLRRECGVTLKQRDDFLRVTRTVAHVVFHAVGEALLGGGGGGRHVTKVAEAGWENKLPAPLRLLTLSASNYDRHP